MVACPVPETAEVIDGAPGVVAGVTEPEALLAELVPVLFVAVTVNV